jgi:hypothetical protein
MSKIRTNHKSRHRIWRCGPCEERDCHALLPYSPALEPEDRGWSHVFIGRQTSCDKDGQAYPDAGSTPAIAD